jgi:hypothetical protein
MAELNLEGLKALVAKRAAPFLNDLLKSYPALIHSLHIAGSAVTEDFDENRSDINPVVVLREIDFSFLRHLGSIGGEHRKRGVAAPLIMTPSGIANSLDVFPMEYLDLKHIHKTVFGPDPFAALRIEPAHLRIQCEREIKSRLIGLRQRYVSSLGKAETLREILSRSVTGLMPLVRGIVYLLGKEAPLVRQGLLLMFSELTAEHCRRAGLCLDPSVFEKVLSLKTGQATASAADLHALFENFYRVLETIDRLVNELSL